MNQYLVSIITPTYNSSLFLKEMLDSILSQTYTNWELLLTDDCSTDSTWDILSEYAAKDRRINISRLTKNSGSGVARNHSIQRAQGRFLAFVDSDDLWRADKLEKQVAFMLSKKAVFSHTSYGFIDSEGHSILSTFHVSNQPVTFKKALSRTEISCLTAMYDQQILGKIYMPEIRRKQDYALWLSILKKGYVSHPLDEELGFYRQHSASATSQKYKLIGKHYTFLKETVGLTVFESIKYTVYWAVNGFVKYYLKKM